EDDRRVLATQLEGELFESRRGGRGDARAGRGSPREGDRRDAGMVDERLTRLVPVAVHEVEDAGGRAGLREDLRQRVRREGCELGGLGDDGVSHRERWRRLP